jgi:hypothetical protein
MPVKPAFVSLLLLAAPALSFSQAHLPGFSGSIQQLEQSHKAYSPDTATHTSLQSTLSYPLPRDTAQGARIARNFRKDNLAEARLGKLSLVLNPLLELEAGRSTHSGDNPFTAAAGFSIGGQAGRSVAFSIQSLYGSAAVPGYMDSLYRERRVLPGAGIPVSGGSPFSYRYSVFQFRYIASRYFKAEAGRGTCFFGEGYRSLLLSSHASPYYFLRLSTTVWKLQYTNLFTRFQNYIPGVPLKDKFGAFHYLSVALTKRIGLSLFEGVIWQQQDSLGIIRGYDISYLNPAIFLHPVQISRASPDNMLLGANLRYKLSGSLSLYGQFLLDDFNFSKLKEGRGFFQHKYGYQAGLKAFAPFGIKGLFLQGELNVVRPYTYAHKSPLQNYSHMNQPLAHPLGANFREVDALARYSFASGLTVRNRLVLAFPGTDTDSSHYGQDIFRSDYDTDLFSFGNFTGQGIRTTLINNSFEISYPLNSPMGLDLYAGMLYRTQRSSLLSTNDSYVYIGLRTGLRALRNDF